MATNRLPDRKGTLLTKTKRSQQLSHVVNPNTIAHLPLARISDYEYLDAMVSELIDRARDVFVRIRSVYSSPEGGVL